jgi:hypothetical protein
MITTPRPPHQVQVGQPHLVQLLDEVVIGVIGGGVGGVQEGVEGGQPQTHTVTTRRLHHRSHHLQHEPGDKQPLCHPQLFLPHYINISDTDAAVHARYVSIRPETGGRGVAAMEEVLGGQQQRAATSPTAIVLARWSAWIWCVAMTWGSHPPVHDWC